MFANSLDAHADDAELVWVWLIVGPSSRNATSVHGKDYLRRSGTLICFSMDLCPRPGRDNSCTLPATEPMLHCHTHLFNTCHLSGALPAVTLSCQSLSTLLTGDLIYIVSD